MDGKYDIKLKLSTKDVKTIIDWYEYCEGQDVLGPNSGLDRKLVQVFRDLLKDMEEANKE